MEQLAVHVFPFDYQRARDGKLPYAIEFERIAGKDLLFFFTGGLNLFFPLYVLLYSIDSLHKGHREHVEVLMILFPHKRRTRHDDA
jgi:hypothetical protein